jgi:RNA polymerase sigma-70 factor (ECF subfamily)
MELLERFAAGDPDAFESLFRQYQRDVFRWILRIVRNRATAEDLTIETFWRMHRAHARFDSANGNCGGWLRRIATNVALDHLRRSRTEVPLPDDLASAGGLGTVEQEDLRRAIYAALGKLSARLRVAILLALVEDEPYDEIANALGISVGAVKVRVHRGVKILRRQLAKQGVNP